MRSQLALVCLALILLAGCEAKDPQPERDEAEAELEPPLPAPPTLPPVGSRVLIRDARGLATGPNPDAPRVYGEGVELRLAEVVAHVDGFVELRTVAAPPSEVCGARVIHSSFELHFFALPKDLEPVLGKPKQVEFDDGTKLAFAPGVPIVGEGAHARLRVDEISFEVPIAADEIARGFQPMPFDHQPSYAYWAGARPLYYGDQQITDTSEPFFSSVYAAKPIEGAALLSFANGCGQFTLRSDIELRDLEGNYEYYVMKGPKDALPSMANKFDPDMAARQAGILGVLQQQDGHFLAPPSEDVWGGLMNCSPTSYWMAPNGAKLLWRETGTAAGVVVSDVDFAPSDVTVLDDRVCFLAVGIDVCIERSQLQLRETECHDLDSFGGRGKRMPEVKQGKAEVSPGLDRDIVRRIVRAHINEVRSCYNGGLVKEPDLAGSVVIAFEIAATGKVSASTVAQDDLEPADDSVSKCIAKAVKRWTFPKPKDATTVSVRYPFELSPG